MGEVDALGGWGLWRRQEGSSLRRRGPDAVLVRKIGI